MLVLLRLPPGYGASMYQKDSLTGKYLKNISVFFWKTCFSLTLILHLFYVLS